MSLPPGIDDIPETVTGTPIAELVPDDVTLGVTAALIEAERERIAAWIEAGGYEPLAGSNHRTSLAEAIRNGEHLGEGP